MLQVLLRIKLVASLERGFEDRYTRRKFAQKSNFSVIIDMVVFIHVTSISMQ